MELVDNALDARLPRSPMRIDLSVHPSSVRVMSLGGEGMGPRDLERHYLRWGRSPKRGKNLLGQYGQGGKAAIGNLGSRFSVESSRPGDPVAWRFADPDYRDRSRLKTYELETVPKRVDHDLGFVAIRIDGVDKRVDGRRVGQRLADTYRPLLESGELGLTLNGTAVKPMPMAERIRRNFRVRAAHTTVRGWVGIVDPDRRGPDFVPGLRCYRLGRLITQGEFFGHPSPGQQPGMGQLVGEVEIPQVSLTINKSDFNRDGADWLDIEGRLHRVLAPLVRQLVKEDQPLPPVSAVRVAEQVRKLLSQALRLAERGELFAGRESLTRPTQAVPPKHHEPPEAGPDTKERVPPAAARPSIGDQAHRRGFGNILIKPLDPAVRSQTVLQGDVKQVIINSQYPLFIERKGDIWYQLETAAREICQGIEGASIQEYERRVNEIVLLAWRLRGRRRRTRPLAAQLQLVP